MELRALCFITLSVLICLSNGEVNLPFGVPPPPVDPFAPSSSPLVPTPIPSYEGGIQSPPPSTDRVFMDSYSNADDVDYDEPTPAFIANQQSLQQQQQQQQQTLSLSEESARASSLLTTDAQDDLARHMEQIVDQKTNNININNMNNVNNDNAPPPNLPPAAQRRPPSAEPVYDGSGYDIAPLNLPPPPVFQLPSSPAVVSPSPSPSLSPALAPALSSPALLEEQQQQQQQQPQQQQSLSSAEYRALAAEERFRDNRKHHGHKSHTHTRAHHHHRSAHSHKKHRSRLHKKGNAFRFRELDNADELDEDQNSNYNNMNDYDNNNYNNDNNYNMPPMTQNEENNMQNGGVDGSPYPPSSGEEDLSPSPSPSPSSYSPAPEDSPLVDDQNPDEENDSERDENIDLPYGIFSTEDAAHPYSNNGDRLQLPSRDERLSEIMQLATYSSRQKRIEQAELAAQQQQQQPQQQQQQQPRMITPEIDARPASSSFGNEPALEPLPRPPVVVP